MSESSQLAGIRELLRIAELQAQAYARDALTAEGQRRPATAAEPGPASSVDEASTVIGLA